MNNIQNLHRPHELIQQYNKVLREYQPSAVGYCHSNYEYLTKAFQERIKTFPSTSTSLQTKMKQYEKNVQVNQKKYNELNEAKAEWLSENQPNIDEQKGKINKLNSQIDKIFTVFNWFLFIVTCGIYYVCKYRKTYLGLYEQKEKAKEKMSQLETKLEGQRSSIDTYDRLIKKDKQSIKEVNKKIEQLLHSIESLNEENLLKFEVELSKRREYNGQCMATGGIEPVILTSIKESFKSFLKQIKKDRSLCEYTKDQLLEKVIKEINFSASKNELDARRITWSKVNKLSKQVLGDIEQLAEMKNKFKRISNERSKNMKRKKLRQEDTFERSVQPKRASLKDLKWEITMRKRTIERDENVLESIRMIIIYKKNKNLESWQKSAMGREQSRLQCHLDHPDNIYLNGQGSSTLKELCNLQQRISGKLKSRRRILLQKKGNMNQLNKDITLDERELKSDIDRIEIEYEQIEQKKLFSFNQKFNKQVDSYINKIN